MSAYLSALSAAYAKAIEISRSAVFHSHLSGDRCLFKTSIPELYIIAGLDANEQELAEALLTSIIEGLQTDEQALADEQKFVEAVIAKLEQLLTAWEEPR